MTRKTETILASLVGKLHPGFALGKRGGVLDTILKSFASALARFELDAAAMMDEFDPRTSRELLTDFERVLGPDFCGRDLDNPTLATRQKLTHQRWTAMGGQSIPYLLSIASQLGYEIEIEEFWPSKTGRLRTGQRLIPDGEQFVWRVKLALNGFENFKTGASQAGDPLGQFILSGIECELRRIAHAHTVPVFSYTLEEAA
ncbi:MAG: hypothetical protein COB78_05655 [Hyphomicrobiales bacterium]|nr:MAG: hypothetical protein COB78_05655 [Hyphomicrobiales bacterium]